MDPAGIQALYRFNTFANENLRTGLLAADEQVLCTPVEGFWFGSVFSILTHVLGGETGWLARLNGAESSPPTPSADDFASVADMVDAWRKKDAEWEEWAAKQTPASLAATGRWRRRDGNLYEMQRWQVATHVAIHSTEHRGHATVAMTKLGVPHSGQDFLDQIRVIA